MKSRWIQALVVFGLCSGTALAHAEDAALERSSRAVREEAGESANRARIVLVGELARDPDLIALLKELLGTAGVELEFASARQFEPDSLFAAGERDGAILVFVRLRTARDARLHFRAPTGDRFLLRRVDLPTGVDAVGRELLGQVIKSSVAVLLHSSAGLSRAEASAALASDATPPERDEPPSEGRAPPRSEQTGPRQEPPLPNEPARPPTPAPSNWALRAGLGYSIEWPGADLPFAHGPGAMLGARLATLPRLGLRLAVERLFTQQLRTPIVRGHVQRTDAQLLLELGLPLAKDQFGWLAIGPGLEISRLTPTHGAADVTIAPPKTDTAPAFRGEASYELAFGRVVLGAAAFVTISLVDTHYDVMDGGARKRVATLGAVRPGGALTLSLR